MKLTQLEKREYDRGNWTAVYLAGTNAPVPAKFGPDNAGAWPVLIGTTRDLTNTVGRKLDAASPLWPMGVLMRVWVEGHGHADRLAAAAQALLEDRGALLRKAWLDLGPDIDLYLLELEMHDVAARIGLWPHDDEGMVMELRRRMRGATAARRAQKVRAG